MIAWPTTLPLPDLSGYRLKKRNTVLRTDMDAGLARERRRSAVKIYDVTLSWTFTKTQKQAFDTFFEDTLIAGMSWFTITLTLNGDLETVNARFIPDSISESALAALNWQVSAQLEVQRV